LGEVSINCPVTGQKISTGIDTDKNSLTLTPEFVGQAFCPHCNTIHRWTKADARIDGDDPKG